MHPVSAINIKCVANNIFIELFIEDWEEPVEDEDVSIPQPFIRPFD